MDVVVAGDVHAADTFMCRGVRVVVPGSTEHLSFGEAHHPGFAWIEASNGEITVRHEDIPPQPRVLISVPAVDMDPDDPTSNIVDRIRGKANPEAMTRMSIHGALARDVFRRLNHTVIEDTGQRNFFSFELDLSRLHIKIELAPDLLWTPRRSISEEVKGAIAHEMEATQDPMRREILLETEQALLAAFAEEAEIAP